METSKVKKICIFTVTFLLTVIFSVFLIAVNTVTAAPDDVYQNNLKIYNSQPTDAAALEYYLLPQMYIQSDAKEIIDLAKSITAGISGDYQKAKAIHDWVANNIYYDWDAFKSKKYDSITALDTLKNKKALCEGYMNLTVSLFQASNIPAKYISGYTTSNNRENHAWCEAFAGGKWIIIDATWDSKNTYENGAFSDKTPCGDKYFDISLKDFSADHEYKDYMYVGNAAFKGNENLKNISVPNGFSAIEDFAFRDCVNLESVKIPGSVIKIGWGAFYNCAKLKSVSLPANVRMIREFAFAGCECLSSANIPNGVTNIGDCTFQQCANLKEITIPNSVITVGTRAFSGCLNLKSVKMSYNVTSIGDYAFWYCENLTEITLPSGIKTIGEGAFADCAHLTICGEKGSVAEKYAKDHHIDFMEKILEKPEPEPEDVVTIDENLNPLASFSPNNSNNSNNSNNANQSTRKVGDPLGDVLYSDITAYINGSAIPTSVIKGVTLVVVEDLAKYGFDVKWDGAAKTLKVELNKNKKFAPLKVEKDITHKPGTPKCKYLYTEIKTYLSGQLVESYAINGVTLIDFELLAKYGKLSWNGKTREIKLTIG